MSWKSIHCVTIKEQIQTPNQSQEILIIFQRTSKESRVNKFGVYYVRMYAVYEKDIIVY